MVGRSGSGEQRRSGRRSKPRREGGDAATVRAFHSGASQDFGADDATQPTSAVGVRGSHAPASAAGVRGPARP